MHCRKDPTNLYFTTARAQAAITGTANRIAVTAGAIDIDAAYVGQASITTLGTIGTGVWNGTAIASGYGGTGFSTYAAGDIIYASAVNTLAKLVAGTDGYVLTLESGLPVWAASAGGGGGWGLTGNAGTVAATNYLGTSDDIDFQIKRNNVRKILLQNSATIIGANDWTSPTIHGLPTFTTNIQGGILTMIDPDTLGNWCTFGPDPDTSIISVRKNAAYQYVLFRISSGLVIGTDTSVSGALTVSSSFRSASIVASSVAYSATTGSVLLNALTGTSSFINFSEVTIGSSQALGVEVTTGDLLFKTAPTYIALFTGTERIRLKKSSGNLLIGTSVDDASSILNIASTTKGLLPPRMTTTQRDAISTPAEGLEIYNLTTHKKNVFTTAWEEVTSA